jgi:Putative Actinobacterial Holin-X, holin superfamily III
MATDLRRSALTHAIGDVLQDVSKLVQMEMRLAKAELASGLHNVVWKVGLLAVAGVFAVVAILALIEAAIFALMSYGMAASLACLIVGCAVAVLALIAYFAGRSRTSVTPARTLQHMSVDIRTAKEHLT